VLRRKEPYFFPSVFTASIFLQHFEKFLRGRFLSEKLPNWT
jgi:hypothetical protein